MAQWYATIGGQRYGPVDEDALGRWVRDGRVTASDLVWSEGMAGWAPAGQVPSLVPALGAVAPPLPGMRPAPVVGAGLKPHRGTVVLVLGILGFWCTICGIIAWVMGKNDLREMDSGIMDPSGRGMTNAGRICGKIVCIIGICVIAIILVMFIVMAVAGGLHHQGFAHH